MPRDYNAESLFVQSVIRDRSLIAGYVPYGHVIHIFKETGPRWPLCGSRAGYRNRERRIIWGDGVCRQCLRILQKDTKFHTPATPPVNRALAQEALEIALEWKKALVEDSCEAAYFLMVIDPLRRALEGQQGAQD